MKDDKGKQEKTATAGTATAPALTIDWELYGKYLDESDLSDADKQAFIETLWSIVVSFVDLGFGVHPVQQASGDDWGQEDDLCDLITVNADAVLGSKDNSKPEFNAAADAQSGPSRGRIPK
ncbi:MAG: hypothetical protein COA47_14330 [Robiginitomaculum sp.]|nr:MAG: hypothetical protein COA47_14330 [Robiginitomaculum sp.]